jgi:hypothetical protein
MLPQNVSWLLNLVMGNLYLTAGLTIPVHPFEEELFFVKKIVFIAAEECVFSIGYCKF